MILSHEYKFIFIKPKKVAGTSVQLALAKHCGEEDVITKEISFDPTSDSTKYKQLSKNYEDTGFYGHMTPGEIKEEVGEDVWNEYYKFTVVRNPWDKFVSSYFWYRHRKAEQNKPLGKIVKQKNIFLKFFKPRSYLILFRRIKKVVIDRLFLFKLSDFERFVALSKKKDTNTKYYFNKNGDPVCDFYIRYEHLDEDYKKV